MIGLVAFWVNRIEAIQWLLFIFIRFLSGEFIPLEFLGSFLFAASKYLPFYYIRYGVIQQFLGVWSFQESVFFVGLQLFWVIILYILIAAIWRIALKRFGAQGG
jgi:ABC-2 type transport system permease protein